MKKRYSSQEIKDFVVKLKNAIIANSYSGFDFSGQPVIIWNVDGYVEIDELLHNFIKENDFS